ncbi:MAG: hypothetical protein JW955_07170 [Sedimentisphaerales bacterium]|nr:hypothetical protein [Sedimentisphaerales bacterium]
MRSNRTASMALLVVLASGAAFTANPKGDDMSSLTERLWPQSRICAAIEAVEKQRAYGLLSEVACQRKIVMLRARLAGSYVSQSLSAADPPLNFIQNGGFEKVNRNSDRNRSRWLWWGGWSWGGDYENRWEDRAEFVHSGQFSARIACTGATGRIGISTPPLPAVPGATGYTLTFWARGQGDNMLFVNFEAGANGTLRERIGDAWNQHTVTGEPAEGRNTYQVYFYSIGAGTIWLDDVELVPIGGALDE